MDTVTTLLIIAVCLLLEGFFSGSEIGVISADRMKLRHRAAKGSKGAKLALKMLEKPEWLLSTTLIGTNISVVTNTTMVTALMLHLFGENGSWMAIIFAAPLIWVFGEIVPKSVFQQRADVLTPHVIFILRFFSFLFYPILLVTSFITRVLAKIAGDENRNPFTLREEIITMLHMPATKEGDIHTAEQSMIRRIFNFTETTVGEVMLPLIEVSAIEKGATVAEAKKISTAKSHVRLPVYDQRIDKIIGILHTLDLLAIGGDETIAQFIRPTHYVPAQKSIKELMFELRKEEMVVAVVVDEFGGAEGIATIEDIMEEVVEDMEDEYDTQQENVDSLIRRLGVNDYMVNARIELDDLCEKLNINLPTGRYTTLGGLMMDKTHAVPEEGTLVKEKKISLTVHQSSARAVLEVRIQW